MPSVGNARMWLCVHSLISINRSKEYIVYVINYAYRFLLVFNFLFYLFYIFALPPLLRLETLDLGCDKPRAAPVAFPCPLSHSVLVFLVGGGNRALNNFQALFYENIKKACIYFCTMMVRVDYGIGPSCPSLVMLGIILFSVQLFFITRLHWHNQTVSVPGRWQRH